MRGRAMEAVVTPFSFREALRHAGREPAKPASRLAKAEHSLLDHALTEYLNQGGFPEAQGLDARTRLELLRNYVDVVLLRDVVERHNLGQPQVLRWLVQQLPCRTLKRWRAQCVPCKKPVKTGPTRVCCW